MSQNSIRSIDVGFSLRTQNMPVVLPADTTEVWYETEAMPPEERVATGTLLEICKELRDAGYRVLVDTWIPPGVQMAIGRTSAGLPYARHIRAIALLTERNTCTDARVDEIDQELITLINTATCQ